MLKRVTRSLLGRSGYQLVRRSALSDLLPDYITEADRAIITRVRPFTMTSTERIRCLIAACRYVGLRQIDGDIVECGVWKGGSMMTAAVTLLEEGDQRRRLWLYDTFEGMPAPTLDDTRHDGKTAEAILAAESRGSDTWAYSPLDEVRATMTQTGYDPALINFVVGKVQETIPAQVPDRIAVLRLDTDWYESTRHELEHLYPRLVPGGVLILDDYGFWTGSQKAVDEYFGSEPPLLIPVDVGRVAVKP